MAEEAHKPITVEGVVIEEHQVAAAISVMRRYRFTVGDVVDALRKSGVPSVQAYRGADRLIQRERKAGMIVFNKSGVAGKRTWTYKLHSAHRPARRVSTN